jgi:hypothetical protein
MQQRRIQSRKLSRREWKIHSAKRFEIYGSREENIGEWE